MSSKSLSEKLTAELNRLKRRLRQWLGLNEESTGNTPAPVSSPSTGEATPESPQEPVKEDIVITSFGSPNCSKATMDPDTQIKDLKVGSGWLSYRWAKGNLRNWGINNDHDARALAIAGYGSDGKQYRCAKFDWISTDRLTRSFENIDSGYNGFNAKTFQQAPRKCFFIMSADGKKRTNVLCV